jgi:beta-lactamase regulating signal transducer with metallopeptidase domain/protocatechuate 3,4-dioxygenase beta subunit/peroxiredoxin
MTAFFADWAMAVLVRGSVLLTVALAASWCFGRRWPLSVSAWHRAILVGLLVLPCAAVWMPRLSVACLSTTESQPSNAVAPNSHQAMDFNKGKPLPLLLQERNLLSDRQGLGNSAASTASTVAPSLTAERPTEQPTEQSGTFFFSWNLWAVVIIAVYLSGVVVALFWLFLGLFEAKKLCRMSTLAEPAWQSAAAHWAKVLGLRRVIPVAVTDQLHVPATLGWLRPMILIPRQLENMKTTSHHDAILLHELVHVARRDAFWQLFLALVGAVYWCHPLMGLVRRKVEAAWDTACDSVCAFHLGIGDYSQSLSDLAHALMGRRPAKVGLSMARSSQLAGRIRQMHQLPKTKECQPRFVQRALLCVVGLAVALLAASLTPVERHVLASEPAVADQSSKPNESEKTDESNESDASKAMTMLSGTVVDEDGHPFPKANVFIQAVDYQRVRDPHHQTRYIRVYRKEWKLVTDSDGGFQFELGHPEGKNLKAIVTVTARGHVEIQQLLEWNDLTCEKLAGFRLVRGRVVAGRILTPDGQPVANASIRAISSYYRESDPKPKFGLVDMQPIASDAEGRFELSIPSQTYTEMVVKTPDWAPQRVAIQADATTIGDVKLAQGWQLSGQLLNRQGQPVGGQVVEIRSFDGGKVFPVRFPLTRSAKTDAEGRFKLLPASGKFTVGLTPASLYDSDDGSLTADGPLVLLSPTDVQLDGRDPSPSIVLQEPEAVKLSGRVTSEDGSPVNGLEFGVWSEYPSVVASQESHNGMPLCELAAAWTDQEGRYTLNVPKDVAADVTSAGKSGPEHKYYRPWPQPTTQAVQLGVGSLRLKATAKDIDHLDWVLKPEKTETASSASASSASASSVSTSKPAASPQPGEEALAALEKEIKAARQRGEDPRLTMLDRCFLIEEQNRGTRAAIGALHFVMRAAATTAMEQACIDGQKRAATLLREHYLDHPDLDLLIYEFSAGWGGGPECEALLRAALEKSPHPYVRAAAGLHLAEYLSHRARMYQMFHGTEAGDPARYDAWAKIQTTEEARKYMIAQRDQLIERQKIFVDFNEQANEQAVVSLLDDVIEHYAGVKGPRYRWEGENRLRLTRPIGDDELGIVPRGVDYSSRAAARKFQVTQLKIGQPAPDLVGKDLQGNAANLSDYRGRVVVLTVGDLHKNDPTTKQCHELFEKHLEAPLTLISVLEERSDQPYYAYNRALEAGITWKVITDPDGELQARWCQITFPEIYVIDAEGFLRFHGRGGEYGEDFTQLVEKLLKR